MSNKNYAFVTLATNELYAKSALALLKTLKNAETKHQIVLMLANEHTIGVELIRILNNAFDKVVSVDKLINEHSSKYDVLSTRPELAVTYTKLHAFSLTEFDACCFLDADTMVVENIDNILGETTDFSAVPEFSWPDSFNTGVFTFKPSKSVFEELMKLAGEQDSSYDGGDQGLLNNYFSGNWNRLSVLYNMPVQNFGKFSMKPENYGFSPAFMKFGGQTKVVHFLGGGGNKPWSQGGSVDSTVRHFKNMWVNMLEDAMAQFSVAEVAEVKYQEKKQAKNEGVQVHEQQSKGNNDKPSFDDIWTHISNQF